MQKLFDFVPSDIKPDSRFFSDEQCEIIRKYAEGPKGYFAVTDERHAMPQRFMPQSFCRMWWIKKLPTDSRLKDRLRCFRAV